MTCYTSLSQSEIILLSTYYIQTSLWFAFPVHYQVRPDLFEGIFVIWWSFTSLALRVSVLECLTLLLNTFV